MNKIFHSPTPAGDTGTGPPYAWQGRKKNTILDGMKDTFPQRQEMRLKQEPMTAILKKFPHLASYDGEVVSSSLFSICIRFSRNFSNFCLLLNLFLIPFDSYKRSLVA